jgi:hypothetical protein
MCISDDVLEYLMIHIPRSDAERIPRDTRLYASQLTAACRRLAAKPGDSCFNNTGRFPRAVKKAEAVSTASELVPGCGTISTRGIKCGGLNGWQMSTRCGALPHWLINCELGIPDEDEAITTSGRAPASISPINLFLSSGRSGAFYE